MSILQIAFKSLKHRAVSSSLTAFSVALGIMLMVAVIVINGIVTDTFKQKGTGYSLILGSKGSDLGICMACVYRIEVPEEPLPYRVYRDDIWNIPGVKLEWAIPITMGDYTEKGNFPIVGTTPRYFAMEYIPDHKYRVRGDIPRKPFEAVIGSRVARVNNWDIGSELKLTHGGQVDHVHDERFKVVGVLDTTGTADDKTVFVNLEGFYLISGHEKPAHEAIARLQRYGYNLSPEEIAAIEKAAAEMNHEDEEPGAVHDHLHAIPDDLKEVSFILVKTKQPAQAIAMRAQLNEGVRAKAVNPIFPMKRFLDQFVGNIRTVLLLLTGIITVVAGVGIFVSIYNSMADRKREIAIMRALGARRTTVFSIIIGESMLLCVGGGLLGLLLGHLGVFAAAPYIEQEAGILVNAWKFETLEVIIFPILLVMGTLVGLLPAFAAYRTDVAESL